MKVWKRKCQMKHYNYHRAEYSNSTSLQSDGVINLH